MAAIIPARGGSKGIPRKNIREFCGKPLIAWTIEAAIASKHVDKVYVSTDDLEIADISRKYGAEIIIRPDNLATDTCSSESAVQHAIKVIESRGISIKLIVFLQATSPIREDTDIGGAIEKFIESSADSLFSSSVVDDYCIWCKSGDEFKSVTYDYLNRGRRQDKEPLILETGSIYVFKPEVIIKYNNRLGGKIENYDMPFWKSFEIDSEDDFQICETFMRRIIK